MICLPSRGDGRCLVAWRGRIRGAAADACRVRCHVATFTAFLSPGASAQHGLKIRAVHEHRANTRWSRHRRRPRSCPRCCHRRPGPLTMMPKGSRSRKAFSVTKPRLVRLEPRARCRGEDTLPGRHQLRVTDRASDNGRTQPHPGRAPACRSAPGALPPAVALVFEATTRDRDRFHPQAANRDQRRKPRHRRQVEDASVAEAKPAVPRPPC